MVPLGCTEVCNGPFSHFCVQQGKLLQWRPQQILVLLFHLREMDYDSQKGEQCQSSCSRNPLTEVFEKRFTMFIIVKTLLTFSSQYIRRRILFNLSFILLIIIIIIIIQYKKHNKKFGVRKIFSCFCKKSLMLTPMLKVAFI